MPWTRLLGPLQRSPLSAPGDWFDALLREGQGLEPYALAVLAGRRAATPGLAFLGGYQAALRALWPAAPAGLGALCATEHRLLRPADMQTRLQQGALTGAKDYVTAGEAARWLLVPARNEAQDAPPSLCVGLLRVGDSGVVLQPAEPLPIVPDVPHARLRLEQAQCMVLPGDGWSDYVRPFRTHEDIHVQAALMAWLYGLGLDQRWPRGLQLQLVALFGGLAEAARRPADEPTTHLLLGALEAQRQALDVQLDAALEAGPVLPREQWRRDRAVLALAGQARARRLDKALASLGIDLRQ